MFILSDEVNHLPAVHGTMNYCASVNLCLDRPS